VTPDPALFLSTIILASGALVAIIGGLLVARFVGLDADEQTNRRVLAAAEGRLASARRRADDARRSLVRWDAVDFFSKPDILDAISRGVSDPAELRRLEEPWFLDEQELQREVASVVGEFAHAREVLPGRMSPEDYAWVKFQKSATDPPKSDWPMVWEYVFDEIVEERRAEANAEREKARRAGGLVGFDPIPFLKLPDPPDFRGVTMGYELRRRDDLAAGYERAKQRVEDYEEEFRRLRDEHAEIVRPDKRLWFGVAILIAFAGLGVAWPTYSMSTGPADLTSVRWFVWPFCGVLAGLIIYVVMYLRNLSHRQPPTTPCAGDRDHNSAAD
jgi:hypothetical protein